MIKHTPGPWVISDARSTKVDLINTRKGDAVGEVVFVDVRNPADALLVAAAPELLAALRRLSFAAMARDNTMGDQCALFAAQAELRDANKQAMQEIAKATGGAA